MEITKALESLSALAHETRLWAFRVLVQAGPEGLPAGDIAEALSCRQNTMSSHLQKLHAAGLIDSERSGRQVVYRANYDTVRELILFLVQDCCAGHSQVCEPLGTSLAACCAPAADLQDLS